MRWAPFLAVSLFTACCGSCAAAEEELLPLPGRSAPAAAAVKPASATFSLVNEGAKLLAAGQSLKAEEILRQAVARHPDSAEALYNFGLAQAFNGRHGEAEASQRLALAKNPRFAAAHLALGVALITQGRAREAWESFVRAEALAGNDEETRSAAMFNRGLALGRLDRFVEAETAFMDCLARTPDDPTPAFQIGSLKMRQKKYESALEWLDTARAALPLESALMRGKALARLHRPTEAKAALSMAENLLAASGIPDDSLASISRIIKDLREELSTAPGH